MGDSDPNTLACTRNLRGIEAAKKHWAKDSGAADTAIPTAEDIEPYFAHGLKKCPGGGTYNYGTVAELPSCSVQAHNDYYKAHPEIGN